MTNTLLHSLRERLLDESAPLAGLLRKCLMLGAETGSETLRDWARKELNGYDAGDEIPDYRSIPNPPIAYDSIGGSLVAKGQTIDHRLLPDGAGEYLPEKLSFRQPIEELQQLAEQAHLNLGTPGLAYAQSVWNGQLDEFESVMNLRFVISGSTLAGILGQIRTKLVDLVADLTIDTPLSELPQKDQVDAAVSHRLGDIYNTTIHGASGPVAIGSQAQASTGGMSVKDALQLLDKVQEVAARVAETNRAEILDAVAELRTAVESDEPDTGEVVKSGGRLRAIVSKFGDAALSDVTGKAVQAVTDLALNGAFG